MLTNQRRELESIKVGHTDIDEDQRHLIPQQAFECFAGRGGLEQRRACPAENRLIAQKLGVLVVDQQDIQLIGCVVGRDTRTGFHRSPPELRARSSPGNDTSDAARDE